ncbi:MAG: TetR family transcriptional regulator [Coprococcus sp.]
MNLNPARKRKYVEATAEIIAREGTGGINIRRVAEAAGCTSAVLYKHFENKDHLVILGSIRFLEPYIIQFMEISKRKDLNSIQMDLLFWKAYIYEAFRNKAIYEMLFFGKYKNMLEEYIFEYYQMFPDFLGQVDGYMVSVIFNSNLVERDLIRLRRAANEGLITMEDATTLSRLCTPVFHGMLIQYPDTGLSENDLVYAAEDCYQLIHSLFVSFVKPGVELEPVGEADKG